MYGRAIAGERLMKSAMANGAMLVRRSAR
jgi:hypothetical protein